MWKIIALDRGRVVRRKTGTIYNFGRRQGNGEPRSGEADPEETGKTGDSDLLCHRQAGARPPIRHRFELPIEIKLELRHTPGKNRATVDWYLQNQSWWESSSGRERYYNVVTDRSIKLVVAHRCSSAPGTARKRVCDLVICSLTTMIQSYPRCWC